MIDEKKGNTTVQWRGYLPKQLSDKAWAEMKSIGLTNESQFVIMAMKFYLDNKKKHALLSEH